MPAGKARILVGAKGAYGCDGYPVVGAEGTVHGCHPTREAALQQQAAIYASQAREAKKAAEATWTGFFYPEMSKADINPTMAETENETESEDGYEGCGCPTCKELNVPCEKCPVCSKEMDKGIHSHSIEKKDYPSKARERMASEGQAMPDGSFPIANATDLRNAIQSVGRAKDYNAAKQHIMRRARALGLVEMLPDDWRNKASKGMTGWGGSIFDMNPFVK